MSGATAMSPGALIAGPGLAARRAGCGTAPTVRPGASVHAAARIMAETLNLRRHTVDLDAAAFPCLLRGVQLLRCPGLRRLVTRVADAGPVACYQPPNGSDRWGRYELNLPPPDRSFHVPGGAR